MKTIWLGFLALGVAIAGCATPNLPRGARLVGGGLMVEYTAPTDGTAILMERTSGRMVATESLGEGDTFLFHPEQGGASEVLMGLFAIPQAVPEGSMMTMPTNTQFQLYFVPAQKKKE
jgi:hypothetical protein